MTAAVLGNSSISLGSRRTGVRVYRGKLLTVRGQPHGGYDGECDVGGFPHRNELFQAGPFVRGESDAMLFRGNAL